MNRNSNGNHKSTRPFPLSVREATGATARPNGPGRVMTPAALFPLALLGLAVLPSIAVAQGPGKEFPCRACSPQLCREDDRVYGGCTWSENGTSKCEIQEQENGCPIARTCRDFGGFCEKPKLALGPSEDEAVRVFRNGGMLPPDGGFYVATRGDQLLLRNKCGTQGVVAEIARHDVGRRRADMVLAGG